MRGLVLKSEDRKQPASLTSACCVAALVDLACESGIAKTEATQTYASGYLCKKCFNSIAKYSGLKEELLSRMFVQRISGLQSLSAEATHHIKHTSTQCRCFEIRSGMFLLTITCIPNLLLLMHRYHWE